MEAGLVTKRVLLLGAVVLGIGCGDGGAPPGLIDDDGGQSGPMTDAGRDGGVTVGPGPLLTVLSPVGTADPASADVVVGSTLKVRCRADRNPKGELVDPASVAISVYAADTSKAVITQAATSTSEPGVFMAEVPLVDVPHGAIHVDCSAADLSTTPKSSTLRVDTLFDRGPEITFLNPMDKGFVAAGVGMGVDVQVRFKVAPRPLADNDPGAAVTDVQVTVGGKPIPALEKSTSEADVYSFPLDFNDTTMFSVVPDTLSVRVSAKHARATSDMSVIGTLAVGVDSKGPSIVVKSPQRVAGQDPVVSGKVDVVLEVTDALAGVDPNQVEIRIQSLGSGKQTFPAAQQGITNTYVASFETGSFAGLPSLAITLVARDRAGNETQSDLPVDVDTVPPWISLDPPTVRERFKLQPSDQCTSLFDPLGDAVNDGDITLNAFRPRAVLWDRPLDTPGVTSVRYAMIDNETAKLYVQHNIDTPLLIDSDNDPNHECDAINLNPADITKAPVTLVLSPVRTTGTGTPGTWVEDTSTTPTTIRLVNDFATNPAVSQCVNAPTTYPGPQPVSSDTTMTRVIKHQAVGTTDVIYAYSPTATGVRSTGKDYTGGQPGLACLVAAAKDNAGNFGFSEPLRVCGNFGGANCTAGVPANLTCTDGCVIPARFRAGAAGAMPRVIQYTN